jgi:hypothetical protein
MNGTHVITRLPFSNTCLKGGLNARGQLLSGIVGAVRIPVASSFRQFPHKCAWELYGICYPRSSREEELYGMA